jgi:hypothetical protein
MWFRGEPLGNSTIQKNGQESIFLLLPTTQINSIFATKYLITIIKTHKTQIKQ